MQQMTKKRGIDIEAAYIDAKPKARNKSYTTILRTRHHIVKIDDEALEKYEEILGGIVFILATLTLPFFVCLLFGG